MNPSTVRYWTRSRYSATFQGDVFPTRDPVSGFGCVGDDKVEFRLEVGDFAAFFMGSVPSLRKHQLLVCSESQDLLLIAQQQWKLEARNRCFSGPEYCRWLKTVLLSQPTPYRNSARAVALSELLQVFEIETFRSDSVACCAIVSSRSSCCLPFCWDYPNSERNPRTCFLYCRRNAIAQG